MTHKNNDNDSPRNPRNVHGTPIELCTIQELIEEAASRSKALYCVLIPRNSEDDKIETCIAGNLLTVLGLLDIRGARDVRKIINRRYETMSVEESNDPTDPDDLNDLDD
jgi:hypothetical protein